MIFVGFLFYWLKWCVTLKVVACVARCLYTSAATVGLAPEDSFTRADRRKMTNSTTCRLAILAACTCFIAIEANAQAPSCFEPSYRLNYETVMQPQTIQRFRKSYSTEFVDQQVTRMRPVLKTRTEEREYRVARPVTETKYREEEYTVWKPVVETSMHDETYTQTQYVTETAERQQQYTTFKPVVETQFYDQRYAVQRPITETQYYQQRYAVQRPVTETQMRTQQYTTLRPVTTVQNRTVDAGGYVAEQTVLPGQVRYGTGWQRGAYATPGPLGFFARLRGAPVYTQQYTPPTVQTQYSYRPNYIQQQFARTSYMPEVQQVQVPVQVQKMQTDIVTQNVPVQRTRLQTDYYTQKVPVQTTRMVPVTEVRKVPYVVQRPVTRTLTRKVPVQQQKWVTETKVRKIPVQSTRMVYETHKQPVQVQYYDTEQITETVRTPVTREQFVPYTEQIMVPRQVVTRTPLAYHDPFSPAIVHAGYSSFAGNIATSIPSTSIVSQPETPSELSAPQNFDSRPRTVMKAVISDPEPEPTTSDSDSGSDSDPTKDDDFLELSDPRDGDPIKQPTLSEPNVIEAAWRVKWNSSLAREI